MEQEPPGFQVLLDQFDFDAARSVASAASSEARQALEERISRAEEEGSVRAERLAGRIQSLARADHYEGLLAIADEAATPRLLALLSVEIRRGADLHLDGAKKRQERFQQAATKHMSAAIEALVLLDTTKARSELERIDERWLSGDQQTELSQLKQQVEDAAAERRDLDARTAEVLRNHHPSRQGRSKGKSPTSTGQRGRGCAGSALVVLALLVLALAI
jgi:hypothetical protein